ncbi:hypothetical protein AB4Y33_43330, partial [Paraburkholderia sp. BR14319]
GNQPPQAGLIALLAGLMVYALTGSSRFAIVSATSSSAAVLAALLAVLVLGVLHGLLVAIGVSLMLTLRKLSEPNISVLGR